MTPVEIIALIIALLTITKLVVFLASKKSWMKVPNMMFAQPIVTMIISLVLAAVVLYYLLAELTIVQIFAAISFVALLTLSTFSAYSKEFMEMANKWMKDKNVMKRCWLPTAVWLVLAIWVLYSLFG